MTWGPADRTGLRPVPGGATAPDGFRAGGVAGGLKPSGRPDLALLAADRPAAAGVVTTTNLVKAPPCVVTEEHVADGFARAVVVNSGNANACTGPEGIDDARRTAAAVAEHLACQPDEVLPLSTGVIGVPLPTDAIVAAVPRAVADLGPDGGDRAAEAILTTDSTAKTAAYRVEDGTGSCTVGGMVKGAGMIEPAMATLLGIVTTDAPLSASVLQPMLRQAVARTFNRISIDACGSTNDTVAVLASGAAPAPPGLAAFQTGLEAVCADLARAVVEDGEGTRRVAVLRVLGAASEDDAVRVARSIAASVLFRCALAGADPNWGRILAAMGGSGVLFDPARVHVTINGVAVCRFGVATAFDPGQAAAAMDKPEVEIRVDLSMGTADATYLTTDLTPEYVTFNTEYTT